MARKRTQNGPNMVRKRFQNVSKMVPRMVLKWFQNGPKMVPKWSQNGPPKPTLSDPGLKPHFGIDFEKDLRSILDSKTSLKIIKNLVWGILESVLIFGMFFFNVFFF